MMRRNRDIEGAVSGMSGGARGKSNGGPASQATTQKGKSVSVGGSSGGDEIFAGRCSTTVNRLPTVLLPGYSAVRNLTVAKKMRGSTFVRTKTCSGRVGMTKTRC